jgi:predicted nucleic acid-binding Zn ribbon protein
VTEPRPLADSLQQVVRALQPVHQVSTSTAALGGVFGRWEEAVGEAVAAHVRPLRLDGDVLVVEVDDPAWATQLRLLESTMRQRLSDVTGAAIGRIECRVGRPTRRR